MDVAVKERFSMRLVNPLSLQYFLARVSATFTRRSSSMKPTACEVLLRTVDSKMISYSEPCVLSTEPH